MNIPIGGFLSRISGPTCCLAVAVICATTGAGSVPYAVPSNAAQAEPQSTQWLTGSQRRTQLRQVIRASWSDITLAQVLERIATTQNINLFLDRRVDKGQEIEIPSFHGSVFEALAEVLNQCDLHGIWIDDVYYIGSLEQVAQLLTARERIINEFRERPEPVRRQWLVRKEFDWAQLVRPSDMLQREFPELDLELPHDLWPAWSSPEMTRLDLLLMISNGFELEPSFDELPENPVYLMSQTPVKLEQPFEFSVSMQVEKGINLKKILDIIKRQFPQAIIRATDRTWSVESKAGEGVRIQSAVEKLLFAAEESSGSNPDAQKVVTLKTQASIGAILATVAKNLNVKLTFAPEIRTVLEKRIDVDVDQISYETLIQKAIDGTGLTFELTDTTLEIRNK